MTADLPRLAKLGVCMTAMLPIVLSTGSTCAAVLVPDGLQPGDMYQLVFVTEGTRDATSSDIADYNAFVQTEAERAGAITESFGIEWFAAGSTATVDARDNAVVETPVYPLLGNERIAVDLDDLWGILFVHGTQRITDQFGGDEPFRKVFHGTSSSGSKWPTGVWLGEPIVLIADWDTIGGLPATDNAHLYALSEKLTVPPHLRGGDADQDLDCDQLDLVQVLQAGKYLTGQPATWGEGDFDGAPGGYAGNPPEGDGFFNQLDIIAAIAGGKYLTGPYAAVKASGRETDRPMSLVYTAATGELAVISPAGLQLTSINVDSAFGVFTGNSAANLGGSFDNDSDTNLFKATLGGSFGSLSFGKVAQQGLSEGFLLSDLTVMGSLDGGGDLGAFELIYVPEPSAFALLSIVMGTLAMCRIDRRCKLTPFDVTELL